MTISEHRTRSVFDRYNVTSEEDLKVAAERLERYIQQKKVTNTVTLRDASETPSSEMAAEPLEQMTERVGIRSRA